MTTPLQAADKLADYLTGPREYDSVGIENIRREGETVTFDYEGTRFCAVVELDETPSYRLAAQ